MANSGQQYCLRWNNHRSNLLTVFDQLLQSEAFTDVTLACEGGVSMKCHKMVLAACSGYFATLFAGLPCKHPVVVLKDVKYSDMKAILEYMYRGEVNVEQQQLSALIQVAETLKVKGLVEENGHHSSPTEEGKHTNNNTISNPKDELDRTPSSALSPPSSITTSTGLGPASPPHSTGSFGKGYPYGKSPTLDRNRMALPLWGLPGVPLPQSPLQSQGSLLAAYEAGEMSPLHRKKLSSLLMHPRDTPILRTVLGQAQGQGPEGRPQADSSQPVSLVCHPDSHDSRSGPPRIHSNGSMHDTDKVKHEANEGSPSPYTDLSLTEEEIEKKMMMMPSSSPQSFSGDMRGVSSGIVPYVQQQKPEWKRYKQYTRNDIESAIEAVKSGMSALQAARKYGVPSRTLYDKVKKRGITTNRPIKRASVSGSSNGGGSNGVAFPYGISGAPVQGWVGHMSEEEQNGPLSGGGGLSAGGLVDHWMDKAEMEREAIAAMASAQAAHALSINSGSSSSPPEDRARSPSPQHKYARYSSSSAPGAPPAPRADSPPPRERLDRLERLERLERHGSPVMDNDGDQDQVEDLSVARTSSSEEMSPPQPPPSRVIVSMQAAREEEEREREREKRERDRERERERDLERGMELRGPIILEETRGSPMEVGGERD